jgi:hypothetical protein
VLLAAFADRQQFVIARNFPLIFKSFRKMQFPFWPYLNQPVFSRTYQTIYNPWRFWYTYQVRFLERCWLREYRPEEHHKS